MIQKMLYSTHSSLEKFWGPGRAASAAAEVPQRIFFSAKKKIFPLFLPAKTAMAVAQEPKNFE